MRKSAIFILLLFIVLSCADESLPTPIEECPAPCLEEEMYLEIIWQERIGEVDGRFYSGNVPLLFKDKVLFSKLDGVFGGEVFIMRDKLTGAVLWEWSDAQHYKAILEGYKNYQDKYLIFCDKSGPLRVLDANNGQEIWKDDLKGNYSGSSITIMGDKVYQVHSDRSDATRNHLARATIGTWKWDTIYSKYRDGEQGVSLHPPVNWYNNEGEEVLIFQDRAIGELIALNVDTDEVMWKHADVKGASLVHHSVVDDLVYFVGLHELLCYNIPTGQLVWRKILNNYESSAILHDTKLHFVDEKLILEARTLTCALNAKTGKMLWRIGGTGNLHACDGQTAYHDGVLYGACQDLFATDINTGKRLWEAKKFGDLFIEGLIVDPETGYLYASNLEYALCLKVVE